MKELTNVQFINGKSGKPEFVVLPFNVYQEMFAHNKKTPKTTEITIPNKVVKMVVIMEMTPTQAWREYLELTQSEVANRLGISQSAYCQMETVKKPRKATLEKIAKAMGINYLQLNI